MCIEKDLELYPNDHLFVDALDDPKLNIQGPLSQYRQFEVSIFVFSHHCQARQTFQTIVESSPQIGYQSINRLFKQLKNNQHIMIVFSKEVLRLLRTL